MTPPFVNFGSLASEDIASASHDVRVESVAGQPPFDPEKLLVEHANDGFVVERLPSGHDSLVLRLRIKEPLSPGELGDTLDLRLGDSDHVVRVPLHATLVEAISVVPASVSLRRLAEGGFQPVHLIVACRAGREIGEVALDEAPPGVRVEDLGAAASGRRRIRLSVNGDVSVWPNDCHVWLRGEGADARFGFKVLKPSL